MAMHRKPGAGAPMASVSSSSLSLTTTSSASTNPGARTSGRRSRPCAIRSAPRCSAEAPTASARPASCAGRRTFQDAGVDQTIFIQQGGKNRHDHICESLELFAAEVMPEFAEREADRERAKRQELAPYVEAAMARKQAMPSLADSEIPVHEAYGNTVALTDDDIQKLPEVNRRRVLTFRRIREIAERAARGV